MGFGRSLRADAEEASGGGRKVRGACAPRSKVLTDEEFVRLSAFIYEKAGIHIPARKKILFSRRIWRRVRATGLASPAEYLRFFFTADGMEQELTELLDAVTTNTTSFYREPHHYEFLRSVVLPQWRRLKLQRPMAIWSAGCSVGMEPYTLSMVLSEFQAQHLDFQFHITATDISARALRLARRAAYSREDVKNLPQYLKSAYLLEEQRGARTRVRVHPTICSKVKFKRLNFKEDFHFHNSMDLIFCRNVVIYFDRPMQELLFTRLCRYLSTGGYLCIGQTETLAWLDLPLEQAAHTIYRRI